MQLTVYFEHPFWIGVLEEERDGLLFVARVVFDAEPSAQEVYHFVLHDLGALRAQMTTGLPLEQTPGKRINPKRLQRMIRRELAQQGTSHKAHEVMRAQYEAGKTARQETTRADREAEKNRRQKIKRDKARQKRRGH